MQLNMVINDELMQQAKLVAGMKSETEIVEIALRAWLELQHPKKQVENPAKALLESDFVGCGQADPLLSTNYKQIFAEILNEKYNHC
jgi:Bacterial antitoxin of type II TA system, VapB